MCLLCVELTIEIKLSKNTHYKSYLEDLFHWAIDTCMTKTFILLIDLTYCILVQMVNNSLCSLNRSSIR